MIIFGSRIIPQPPCHACLQVSHVRPRTARFSDNSLIHAEQTSLSQRNYMSLKDGSIGEKRKIKYTINLPAPLIESLRQIRPRRS